MSLLQRGCIKSIQRGTKDYLLLGINETTRIDITNVNLDKSILLVDYTLGTEGRVIFNLLSNAIVIKAAHTDPTAKASVRGLTYQVVEFY